MNHMVLLTLYKQHYRRDYDAVYHGDYSCWGYYDGMSLEMVEESKDLCAYGKDSLHLTDAWYKMGDLITDQSGKCIQQHICLLRWNDEQDIQAFLKQKEIFMCICIIQLAKKREVQWKGRMVELEARSQLNESPEGIYGKIMSFRTIDNGDLILAIKGNSYTWIENTIREFGQMKDVVYTHSICGVSQEYLKIQEDENYLFKSYGSMSHPFYEDSVKELQMRVVMNGKMDIEQFKEGIGLDGESYYALGHSDIILSLTKSKNKAQNESGLSTKDAIRSMRKKIGTGHDNNCYGISIYNIETTVIVNQCSLKGNIEAERPSKGEEWCIVLIKKLKKVAEKIKNAGNEILYSYYQAMIQSLSMLAPYEESSFSRDVFYSSFPSLWLFHRQLDEVLIHDDNVKLDELSMTSLDTLINTLARYLEVLDPVLYRSIHTEQTFLMAPGYGGVLYSIPSKLSLMYMAFLRAVIQTLNDIPENGGKYVYECILVPTMSPKPQTGIIDFTTAPDERLIEVKIPYRCLFAPHLMCLILGHEMAHYVGEKKRNRNERLGNMCYILSAIIGNAIYSVQGGIPEALKNYESYINEDREKFIEYFLKKLYNQLAKNDNNDLNKYFFDNIIGEMETACRNLLDIQKEEILRKYSSVEGAEEVIWQSAQEERAKILEQFRELYKTRQKNVYKLIRENYIRNVVSKFRNCFKETYADMISLAMLGAQSEGNIWVDYLDSFYLSEGLESVVDKNDSSFINRIAVVVDVLSENENSWKKKWEDVEAFPALKERTRTIYKSVNDYIKDRKSVSGNGSVDSTEWLWDSELLVDTVIVWECEKKYLSKCLNKMYEEIYYIMNRQHLAGYIQEIRNLYHMLKDTHMQPDEWLKPLDQIIWHYESDVDLMIKKDKESNQEKGRGS